ncbi:MAG: hypothetical protein IPJ88_07475 [Myxococcales bacterium]|nr:MAG: hypothetical protein IPJ88_07475 [Myxococcales bacterium]
MPVEAIRPGMKGYGLTVFKGTRPERFDVDVIGVLHNFQPDQDLVLVRTTHPLLEHANTVAGMSGSPVYINDKLIGAYAYGWLYGKDPVAGVTPIKNMLVELHRPLGTGNLVFGHPIKGKGKAKTHARLNKPFLGAEKRDASFALNLIPKQADPRLHDSEQPSLTPAATPLMVGGLEASLLPWLSDHLKPFGLFPIQGGGGGAQKPSSKKATRVNQAKYVDGGAINVQLVSGDINMSGTGTVTYVQGRRLIAFGHPMLEAGEVGLPTATARVLHIFASQMRSFKISEGLDPLGTMVHDRQSAIVIDTEIEPETIPLSVKIEGVKSAPRTTWNMKVASHRNLTPMLAMTAAANAVQATASDVADATFTVTSVVDIEGHGPQKVVDVGYSSGGLSSMSFFGQLRMFSFLEAAYANPFEKTKINSITMQVQVKFDRDVTHLISASVGSDEVNPGSRVPVYLTLQKYGEEEKNQVLYVDIPSSMAGQSVELIFEPGNKVDVEQPQVRNLEDILEIIRSRFSANMLVASLKVQEQGLRLRGHVVRGLPDSALSALQPQNSSLKPSAFVTQFRKATKIGGVVVGSASLKINVREVAEK